MSGRIVSLALTIPLIMALAGCSPKISFSTPSPTSQVKTTVSASTSSQSPLAPTSEPAEDLPSPTATAVAQPSSAPQDQPVDFVIGLIKWPDGKPARNVDIWVYPSGVGQSGISQLTPLQITTTDLGFYVIKGCPCAFSMWFFEDTVPGAASPYNGGRTCLIPLQHNNYIDEVPASPGDVLNWTMVDIPCSSTNFNPRDYRLAVSSLLQAQANARSGQGDTTAYAGTWQAARARLGQ